MKKRRTPYAPSYAMSCELTCLTPYAVILISLHYQMVPLLFS